MALDARRGPLKLATATAKLYEFGGLPRYYDNNTTAVAADTLAIPVTTGKVNKTLGADAEALTLADGEFDGQLLDIDIVAVGAAGIGTLTPSTAEFTTITFNHVGESCTLRWLNSTDGWSIVSLTLGPTGTYAAKASPTPLDADIASAADSLAIPVTAQHVSKTTGGDAEALTLANGTPGQLLTITLVTDGGGDGTLTPATATGFATIVFADAGDTATLKFIDSTVGWILIGASGVAAPPAITV